MEKPNSPLAKVALGLQLVYSGLVIVVLAIIASVVLVLAAPRLLNPFGVYALLGLTAIGGGLEIVGKLFCLSVPNKSHVAGVIYTSVAFTITGAALGWLALVVPIPYSSQISNVLTGTGSFLFVLFLKKWAEFLGATVLKNRAQGLLVGSIVLISLYVGLTVATPLVPADASLVVGLVMLGVGILMILLFLRYANLVSDLRAATLESARVEAFS